MTYEVVVNGKQVYYGYAYIAASDVYNKSKGKVSLTENGNLLLSKEQNEKEKE